MTVTTAIHDASPNNRPLILALNCQQHQLYLVENDLLACSGFNPFRIDISVGAPSFTNDRDEVTRVGNVLDAAIREWTFIRWYSPELVTAILVNPDLVSGRQRMIMRQVLTARWRAAKVFPINPSDTNAHLHAINWDEPVVRKAPLQFGASPATTVDAPLCMTCGTKMRPAGSCYVCEACGSTSGCS